MCEKDVCKKLQTFAYLKIITTFIVSKILKTINLVVGAIRPKNVTWGLNRSGTGYEIITDEMDNKFGTDLPYSTMEDVKKEKGDIFEQFLTESGIPWIQPKQETDSKTGISLECIENPKVSSETLKFLHQTNLETKKSMQESIDLKTRIIKNTRNKSKNKVLKIRYCSYTPEELAREKKVDIETRRRIKELIESKSKTDKETIHARTSTEELLVEKQADFESRKRLRDRITEHHRKEKARLDEQIKFQRKQAELQAKSAEQIAQKKIELKKAKAEKEKIIKQMKEKQTLISEELKKEKETLEKAKAGYEKIKKQSEIEKARLDKQIKFQREQIELQTKSAGQIAQKKIELEEARKERDKMIELIQEKQSLISEDLKRERLYLEKAKTDFEKVEKQSELEKTQLDEQIQFQREQAELQTKSAGQIAQKKIALEEAKFEKERIEKLIQEKQSLISEDLKKEKQRVEEVKENRKKIEKQAEIEMAKISEDLNLEKQHVEEVKEKRKKIEKQAELEQNLVAEKINKEIEKIENQAKIIQKIEQEQENLQSLIHKKQKIMEIVKHEKTKLTEQKLFKKHADMESRRISDELLEDKFIAEQEKEIVKLIDHKKSAQYYLDRYDNELYFKEWFDTNFPDYTIEDAIKLAILKESPTLESQSFEAEVFDSNKELQHYINKYNNEPMYKDWFDRKYPGQTIYEIIGMPEPKETPKKLETNLPNNSKMFQYQYF